MRTGRVRGARGVASWADEVRLRGSVGAELGDDARRCGVPWGTRARASRRWGVCIRDRIGIRDRIRIRIRIRDCICICIRIRVRSRSDCGRWRVRCQSSGAQCLSRVVHLAIRSELQPQRSSGAVHLPRRRVQLHYHAVLRWRRAAAAATPLVEVCAPESPLRQTRHRLLETKRDVLARALLLRHRRHLRKRQVDRRDGPRSALTAFSLFGTAGWATAPGPSAWRS